MIRSFSNPDTAKLFNRESVSKFRAFELKAIEKLNMLNAATSLLDLRVPPSNRLEKLKGNRAEQFSIRINKQWRICFVWRNGNAYDVEIVDYH